MSDDGAIRRRDILRALATCPRTVRGLLAFCGLSSTSTVHHHLMRLEEQGLIAPVRGWELTPKGREALEAETS